MPSIADSHKYITEFELMGLKGRVLRLLGPSDASKEVVFVYGHHSSLERWWGMMDLMSRHVNVTMPDLPGFGGMESLYKVGKTASFDDLADYLAMFLKLSFKGKKVTLVGMSLGFVIITRALQRHPDLELNVHKLVSLFGFASSNDFKMTPRSRFWNGLLAKTFSLPVTSNIYRGLLLNPLVLRSTYDKTKNARQKFAGLTLEQKKANMDFEVGLWRDNDLRTHMHTAAEFLNFDNTKGPKVNLPVYHIAVHNDRYFNNESVEKHFRQIFSDYHLVVELKGGTHAPTAVRTAEEAASLMPKELLNILA